MPKDTFSYWAARTILGNILPFGRVCVCIKRKCNVAKSLWCATQKKGPYTVCGQRRPWSACAFGQADLGLRCPLTESMDTGLGPSQTAQQRTHILTFAVRIWHKGLFPLRIICQVKGLTSTFKVRSIPYSINLYFEKFEWQWRMINSFFN